MEWHYETRSGVMSPPTKHSSQIGIDCCPIYFYKAYISHGISQQTRESLLLLNWGNKVMLPCSTLITQWVKSSLAHS